MSQSASLFRQIAISALPNWMSRLKPRSRPDSKPPDRRPQRRRRRGPWLPAVVRKEITQCARLLRRHHRLFKADSLLKDRAQPVCSAPCCRSLPKTPMALRSLDLTSFEGPC